MLSFCSCVSELAAVDEPIWKTMTVFVSQTQLYQALQGHLEAVARGELDNQTDKDNVI